MNSNKLKIDWQDDDDKFDDDFASEAEKQDDSEFATLLSGNTDKEDAPQKTRLNWVKK